MSAGVVVVVAVITGASGIALPHCGQNIAYWRTDTPHDTQRRAISGSDIKTFDRINKMDLHVNPEKSCKSCLQLNPVHGVEEILALRVDPHTERLSLTP